MSVPLSDDRAPWSPATFERRFAEHPDPWGFASSPYELGRYRVTLDGLRRARYRRAFEPGCAIGVLTAALAARCDEVLATDVSETALARARARCAAHPGVRLRRADLRDVHHLEGSFDLVVLSEVAYYFAPAELEGIVERVVARLAPGGELVAVHWLGHSDDHRLHGDEVHRIVAANGALTRVRAARHPGFRLDGFVVEDGS